MNVFKNHFDAIVKAFTLLKEKRFSVFFIPGLIIALFFYVYINLIGAIQGLVGYLSYTPWIGNYMEIGVDSVFTWINGISIYIYQFIIITLLSPFHTVLSQRVETEINSEKFSSTLSQFINDILRTIGVIVLGGIIYLSLYLIWSMFAWSFGLSFLSPFVSLILVAFFTGFNSYDYALERHKVSVKESWKYAFKHPLSMIITGLIFTLLLYIPIIGVVIAPVLLTMVGTINYLTIAQTKGV